MGILWGLKFEGSSVLRNGGGSGEEFRGNRNSRVVPLCGTVVGNFVSDGSNFVAMVGASCRGLAS